MVEDRLRPIARVYRFLDFVLDLDKRIDVNNVSAHKFFSQNKALVKATIKLRISRSTCISLSTLTHLYFRGRGGGRDTDDTDTGSRRNLRSHDTSEGETAHLDMDEWLSIFHRSRTTTNISNISSLTQFRIAISRIRMNPTPLRNKFHDRQFPRFLIYGVSRFKNHRPVNSINKQSGIIVVNAVFESRWPTDVSPLNQAHPELYLSDQLKRNTIHYPGRATPPLKPRGMRSCPYSRRTRHLVSQPLPLNVIGRQTGSCNNRRKIEIANCCRVFFF